jgi:hypothetical protein
MKERKVKHIKSDHVRQHRRSRLLSPVIIVELAVVLAIAGVGVGTAFGFQQHNVTNTYAPWAGTASVTESANYAVANYSLVYNAALTQVTGVQLGLTKTGGATAKVQIAVLNASNVIAFNTTASTIYPTNSYIFTLNASVGISQVDAMNVILSEP